MVSIFLLLINFLGYFLRAYALDPENPMVNLSLGLAYVHYGLKRQSTNRQYLLLQGHAFLSHYMTISLRCPNAMQIAEGYYNIGRLYQLLGISYIALEFYNKAEKAAETELKDKNIISYIYYNKLLILINIKNNKFSYNLLNNKLYI